MLVYGPGTFFILKERQKIQVTGDPSYRIMEDGKVAVHLTWLLKGYEHSASYHGSIKTVEVLDWCHANVGNEFIMHQSGNVLFKDENMATMFKLAMSG